MTPLDRLESESITILREAFYAVPRLAMLWSFGKDSGAMIHLARKAFFGRVPFALLHCDTGLEMEEVYAFRDRACKEWNVTLITQPCPPLEQTDASLPPDARVAARKTLGLKAAIAAHGFKGIITGIRRDEEATRAKERVFSPRREDGQWDAKDQPPELWGHYNTHVNAGETLRIHPLLHWSERDVWDYIKRESIAIAPLYFAKPYHQFEGREFGGKTMRFRSIGERGITWPTESNAATIDEIIAELAATRTAERAGRPMGEGEDESSFERLRLGGYL
jgi:sulfate adenylyltransferase subunit 2